MGGWIRRHWRLVASGGAVVAVLAAVVLIWFQPQRLLYDDVVHDPVPEAVVPLPTDPSRARAGQPMASAPEVLARGDFRSRGHHGEGRAQVLDLGGGARVLRLEDFATTNGPDLRVYLSPAPPDAPNDELNDGAVSLGNLKGNKGDQNYPIPESVRLSDHRSVVIWCKRFSYAFTTAPLA